MPALRMAALLCSALLLLGPLGCGRSSLGKPGSGANGGAGSGGIASTGPGGNGGTGAGASGGIGGTGAGGIGGTGAGGIGGTGPGGNGGFGGTPGVENCLNGIDDDGDGAIDCADSDCSAGFTCTPAVPPGWTGPIALYEGAGGTAPPECSNSGAYLTLVADGFEGLSASPAICPLCMCSSPVGVACAVSQARFFGNSQCLGGGGTLTIGAGFCSPFVSINDPAAVQWFSAPAAGGVCIATPNGAPVLPPVSWGGRARSCGGASQGGGCGTSLCVARPQGLFESALCIVRDGAVACPGGGYSQRVIYYQSSSDTRACSACGCGAPSGMSCTGKLELWDNWTCSANLTTLTAPGQCAALAPDSTPLTGMFKSSRSIKYTPGPAQGGSCTATPSNATGTVVPSQPLTICCTP